MRFFIPLIIFLSLVFFFWLALPKDPSLLPSALINEPVPPFALSSLTDIETTITENELKGQVSLLNVWATWCAPCREEHPTLIKIHDRSNVPIYGLNYKDTPQYAINWLSNLGDPYDKVVNDADGQLAIDLGVYGVPETFIVDKNGVIRHKFVGILTMDIWEQQLQPVIDILEGEELSSTIT